MPVPSKDTPVPPVNARVDVWFDGYDEYYPGRVERVVGTHQFHVILDDGTDWDIDVRKHVFKLGVSGKEPTVDTATPPPHPTRRRTSGRAFRKNTAQKVPRDEDQVERRRSSRVEAVVAEKKAAERDHAVASRTRPRRGVAPVSPVLDMPEVVKPKRVRKRDESDEEEETVSKKKKPASVVLPTTMQDLVGEQDAIAGLSTKAVTAIAVDAALESAKAVIKPLSDRLDTFVNEIGKITETASKAANMAAEVRDKPWNANAITGAALENFQLDVSEIIGGGEARIKAYSGLSQHEFESLHRIIEQQQRALKELDRLLYAAKEFASSKNKKDNVTADDPMNGGDDVVTDQAAKTG